MSEGMKEGLKGAAFAIVVLCGAWSWGKVLALLFPGAGLRFALWLLS